jgi:hypothetical protein
VGHGVLETLRVVEVGSGGDTALVRVWHGEGDGWAGHRGLEILCIMEVGADKVTAPNWVCVGV